MQSLQRQLEARDAAVAQMQDRIREQEGVAATQAALIQQMEDDILRSADWCSDRFLMWSKARLEGIRTRQCNTPLGASQPTCASGGRRCAGSGSHQRVQQSSWK